KAHLTHSCVFMPAKVPGLITRRLTPLGSPAGNCSPQESSMFRSRSTCCYCILCTFIGLALAFLMLLAGAPAANAQPPKGPVSFINDVAPILKENCFACHDAKKKKGKLEITSYE